jgi:sterol desaturase/sphingolipid hydroxylase (fatty acid hydroxylase superfamily)
MNYYNYISGGMTPQHLLAALSFAAMGWFVYKSVTAAFRKVSSHRTPAKWCWSFWIRDNWKEAFQHSIIMFLLVRFTPDALMYYGVSQEWINGKDPMLLAVAIGFLKSFILDKVKKYMIAQKKRG